MFRRIILFISLIFIFEVCSFAQEKRYNIPPESVLKSKVDTRADYSEKLELIPENEPVNTIYKSFLNNFTKEDIQTYKTDQKNFTIII